MSTVALHTVRGLLIEDDDGDALLVEDLLADVSIVRRRTLRDGLQALGSDIDCVLLDLGLPDAVGLDTVSRVRSAAPEIAVIVLDKRDRRRGGRRCRRAGLPRQGPGRRGLLARAIRYAMGRRQAEHAQQMLRIAEVQTDENARLERGLMARPLVADPAIWMASSYRPGRRRSLLGGDFFDVVETADASLHALVGDVCGHGSDEAALGASLRIAWRALTLSDAAVDVSLRSLQLLLEHERQIPSTFATLCALEIEPGRAAMLVRRAGHPPPVLIDATTAIGLPHGVGGPPLGVVRRPRDSCCRPTGRSCCTPTG